MTPEFLASVELDQRQRIIFQSEKLREMLGASRQIAELLEIEERVRASQPGSVEPVMRVSGVLRYVAEDAKMLFRFLNTLRAEIGRQLQMSVSFAVVPYQKDLLDPTNTDLELSIRSRKDAKSAVVSPAMHPLFAQCQVIPDLPANHWRPDLPPEGAERRLVNAAANTREAFADQTRSGIFGRFAEIQKLKSWHPDSFQKYLPVDFEHLIESEQDSYIGLLKADGDGLGRLLLTLKFDDLGKDLSLPAHEAAYLFSQAIEECLEGALVDTVDALTKDWKPAKRRFPVVPLVRAGEDFWILCRRDLAIHLAVGLVQNYAKRTGGHDVLKAALKVAGLAGTRALTLSVGLLFAKQGYPFDAQIHHAEALVRSAKQRRGGQKEGAEEGCIDYQWLESSGRETLGVQRANTLSVQDGTIQYALTSRPFTAQELGKFVTASRELAKAEGLRGKLHELESIFRAGNELSQLRFDLWARQLSHKQWEAVKKAVAGVDSDYLGDGQLWRMRHGDGVFMTPLADLVELSEIQRVGGRE